MTWTKTKGQGPRIRHRFLLPIAAGAILALALTGCEEKPANGADPSSSPSSSQGTQTEGQTDGQADSAAEAVDLVLTKSGGVAGVNITVAVDADGTWFSSDGTTKDSGTLSDEQIETLATLAADDNLSVTDRPSGPPQQCNDVFNYVLAIGDQELRTDSCGKAPNDVFTQIVDLLTEATGI